MGVPSRCNLDNPPQTDRKNYVPHLREAAHRHLNKTLQSLLCKPREGEKGSNCKEQTTPILMRFQRPCLDCGELSENNRCQRHQEVHDRRQRRRLDSLPKKSSEDKSRFYNSEFRAKAKQVKDSAVACYLCGNRFSHTEKQTGKVQADHVYPSLGNESPILAAHATCNRSKGKKDFDPKDFPDSPYRSG